ncbi:hypothetical protein [Burkholderia sp. HI2500]|uniref:hypothetical protein n=1 Tax=Burkholderia sp. HI2500 TaxID=2015358 RepID=UPI000B7AB116|nr:hypothetical protein [Burkholderia sp. HI2500]OXJ09050.1 hypothetical protein CFB45_18450 [Burkholderia sp. HI2500]
MEQVVPGRHNTILKRSPLTAAATIDARTQSTAEPAMALPLAWLVKDGTANTGLQGQRKLLERGRSGSPKSARVIRDGE